MGFALPTSNEPLAEDDSRKYCTYKRISRQIETAKEDRTSVLQQQGKARRQHWQEVSGFILQQSVSNTETALKASIVESITVRRRMRTEPGVCRGVRRKAQLTTTGEIRALDRAGGLVKTWDREHQLNHSDLQG